MPKSFPIQLWKNDSTPRNVTVGGIFSRRPTERPFSQPSISAKSPFPPLRRRLNAWAGLLMDSAPLSSFCFAGIIPRTCRLVNHLPAQSGEKVWKTNRPGRESAGRPPPGNVRFFQCLRFALGICIMGDAAAWAGAVRHKIDHRGGITI